MRMHHIYAALVQFIIDSLEVLQVYLIQYFLMEPGHEIRVQEPMMSIARQRKQMDLK